MLRTGLLWQAGSKPTANCMFGRTPKSGSDAMWCNPAASLQAAYMHDMHAEALAGWHTRSTYAK